MNQSIPNLTKEGRGEVALAIILWKDFKSQGKFDIQITGQAIKLTQILGVNNEFNDLLSKVPPMQIEPRYP